MRCYDCEGLGHFDRECPIRIKREVTIFDCPGGKQRRTFKAFAAPCDKPAFSTRRVSREEIANSGKDEQA